MAQLYSYPWYFAVYITLSRIRLTANLAARVCVCVATGRRVTKDSSFGPVAIFAAIDQGHHPPLRSLSDLPLEARRYAALDAWCTLRAWEGWQEQFHAAGEGSKDSPGTTAHGAVPAGVGAERAANERSASTEAQAHPLPVEARCDGSGGRGAEGKDPVSEGKDPVMAVMERCQRARSVPTFSFEQQGSRFQCTVTITGGCEVGMTGVAVTGCEAQSKKQAKKAAAIAWMSAADGLAAKPV